MSVKSVFKKVGKVALKVAPYAAMAIPGVGIPLAMAIAAGSKIADKKIEGASWKNALISGGISGGLAGVGAGALKGIGPSSGALAKIGAGAAGKTAGTGVGGKVGAVLGNMAVSKATSGLDKADYEKQAAKANAYSQDSSGSSGGVRTAPLSLAASESVMPRGGYSYNDDPMNQVNQQRPNLAQSIFQGRQQAIQNQPFRSGYDVNVGMDDQNQPIYSRMPPIYSSNDSNFGNSLNQGTNQGVLARRAQARR